MQLINEDKANRINRQLTLLLHYLHMHEYQFTTISPASHQLVNDRPSNSMGKTLTDIFGWNRVFKLENVKPDLVDLMHSAEILQEVDDGWKSLYRVSSLEDHLFFHSAFPTIDTEAVFFGPDTYRFAQALKQYLTHHQQPIQTAVDIGTGCGAGAVLMALALPQADIIALDINHDALNLARVNFAVADMSHITLMHSNLLHNVEGNFDLIVANPPYLLDEWQRAYRHGGGQMGSGLSLDIVEASIERLHPNGDLLLYTGVAIINGHDAFLEAVTQKLEFAPVNYSYTEIDPDIFGEELAKNAYANVDRIAAVVLIVRKHPT